MRDLSDGVILPTLPFCARVGALVLVAAVVAGVERLVRGDRATRWMEYGALLAGAGLGSILGAAVDAVTSSISPEYFAFGKGLGAEAGLTQRALLLGAQAGFVGGAVITGILLVAMKPDWTLRRVEVARLARASACVAICSFATAAVVCLGVWRLLAQRPLSPYAGFQLVWCTHLGVYVGAIAAMIHVARRAKRSRIAGSTRGA